MPKQEPLSTQARRAASRFRNTVSWITGGRPGISKPEIKRLARRGLGPKVGVGLDARVSAFSTWVTSGGKAPAIRTPTDTTITSTTGAQSTFVGIGMDEHVATRLQTTKSKWAALSTSDAEDISGARSRTADLVWPTGDPSNPIAGHTPGIKWQPVSGTTSAITTGHSGRDTARESAVNTTHADISSPSRARDTALMGSLATIKHMTTPAAELRTAKTDTAKLTVPRYSALTNTKDLRNPSHFEEMVDHVQEARERLKWETASVMKADPRLSPLVPPTIDSYLGTHGNDPLVAMDKFRYDTHNAWIAPPINTAPRSDTEDLSKSSLHTMATTAATGTRRRALSDARLLPVTIPTNARGR